MCIPFGLWFILVCQQQCPLSTKPAVSQIKGNHHCLVWQAHFALVCGKSLQTIHIQTYDLAACTWYNYKDILIIGNFFSKALLLPVFHNHLICCIDHGHHNRSKDFMRRTALIHYCDVIMDTMASQIISLTTVSSTVYSGAVQRKHQSSASLAFVRGIRRWPVNSPHKWPVTRKMFLFDDVIMCWCFSVFCGGFVSVHFFHVFQCYVFGILHLKLSSTKCRPFYLALNA